MTRFPVWEQLYIRGRDSLGWCRTPKEGREIEMEERDAGRVLNVGGRRNCWGRGCEELS